MTAVALIVVAALSLWAMGRPSGPAEPRGGELASGSLAISAPGGQPTLTAAADGRPPSDAAVEQSAQVPAAARAAARAAAPASPPSPAAADDLTARINAATRAPHADTALLATIARRRHAMPPEVDELIRRHQAGASPKELEQWLRDHPIKDVGDRVAVLHWLREIGAGNGEAAR